MKRFISCLIVALPVVALGAEQELRSGLLQNMPRKVALPKWKLNSRASKGNSQAVKDFGAMMVKDHTGANAKLKSVATARMWILPSSSSAMQMASKAKLEVLTGDTFDKAYIKNQVSAHEQTVSLFKKENRLGHRRSGKAFAKEDFATVQAHLRKIRDIAAQAGVETKVKRSDGMCDRRTFARKATLERAQRDRRQGKRRPPRLGSSFARRWTISGGEAWGPIRQTSHSDWIVESAASGR